MIDFIQKIRVKIIYNSKYLVVDKVLVNSFLLITKTALPDRCNYKQAFAAIKTGAIPVKGHYRL